MKSDSIFDTLNGLGLTSAETRFVFNHGTRDVDQLTVWKDSISGVIYIDDFYTGDDTYIEGAYREEKSSPESSGGKPDFERFTDANRRFGSNIQHVAGKKVMDFGCGAGEFLKLVKPHCQEAVGVELQQNYVKKLNELGIKCFTTLDDLPDRSFDVCVSFHVIEHLPNPIEVLTKIKEKLSAGGTLVVEVPHANDFLLSSLSNESFKRFTLWSQHLVLHTRESMKVLLKRCGFNNITVTGVQRYPISNHLQWLANGIPGGHKSSLSAIDSAALHHEYSNALSRIDATDTLVAIAKHN